VVFSGQVCVAVFLINKKKPVIGTLQLDETFLKEETWLEIKSELTAKKGWFFSSAASVGPPPSLFLGSFISRRTMKSVTW